MLLFYCAEESALPEIRRDGLPARDGGGVRLWTRLSDARASCAGAVVVVEAGGVDADGTQAEVRLEAVPPEALRNVDPYLPPEPVAAGGGYVVRDDGAGPEVLLIFRRGAWDLPKGKQDDGESIEACALREVREEIGVEELHVRRALGTTVHGYARKGAYQVKTTHWFLMDTPERRFTPQEDEDIASVDWVPWAEARERVGYETLREHMRRIEPLVLPAPDAR